MGKEDIQSLLVKYICNEASATEALEVKEWISLHPENELYFLELYDAWQASLTVDTSAINEELAFSKFKAATIKPGLSARSKWYRLAVLFTAPVVIAAATLLFVKPPVSGVYRLSAQIGSVKKTTLSDGTIIWLNAGSTITCDAGFGKSNRMVYLSGEALFDIGHNIAYPFIVKTKSFTVRDVGTRFNLKAYPEDAFLETAVLKGEVSVENNAVKNNQNISRIFVKPRQVLKIFAKPALKPADKTMQSASHNPVFNEVEMHNVDSSKMNVYDGWINNKLVFDGSTLEEIVKILERRYNVNIIIADLALRNIRYSGNFNNIPSIARVMDIIRQNTPLSYTINNNNVTITKTKGI